MITNFFSRLNCYSPTSSTISTRPPIFVVSATKKGGGSTKNGRDSRSQRRGVKIFGGQHVKAGGIIIRQLGTKVYPGQGVGMGKDYTLFAKDAGIVQFKKNKYRKSVSVIPPDLSQSLKAN